VELRFLNFDILIYILFTFNRTNSYF